MLRINIEKAQQIAKVVAARVAEIHALQGIADIAANPSKRPPRWNKLAGQWLVYGMEKYIGFGNGVELCSVVERAWRKREPLEPKIESLLLTWFPVNETKGVH